MPTLSDLEKRLAEFIALRDTCAALTQAQLDAAAYILFGAPGYWTPAMAAQQYDAPIARLQKAVDDARLIDQRMVEGCA